MSKPPGDREPTECDTRSARVRRSLRRRDRPAARPSAPLRLAQREAYARRGPSLC